MAKRAGRPRSREAGRRTILRPFVEDLDGQGSGAPKTGIASGTVAESAPGSRPCRAGADRGFFGSMPVTWPGPGSGKDRTIPGRVFEPPTCSRGGRNRHPRSR